MQAQTVRAVLAYILTLAVLACLMLVAFAKLDQFQSTLVGSVLGAVLTNWKVPLAYFFDGVAMSEQVKAAPVVASVAPVADPVAPPAAQP